MAVRNGLYKAHYWTWTNSIEEFNRVWLSHIPYWGCCCDVVWCRGLTSAKENKWIMSQLMIKWTIPWTLSSSILVVTLERSIPLSNEEFPNNFFHVGNFRKDTIQYKQAFQLIDPIVQDHKSKLKPGEPQLNYCDRAVMVCRDGVDYWLRHFL